MIESSAIRLLDRSSVAEARRSAVEHAARAGFDDPGRSDVAIVATELATNLLRHARGGVLSVSSRLQCADGKLLLVAVDQGPGIADLDKCFADGYSSAGSSGTGLGAISRLSTCVDVYSTPKGTVLAAELMRAAHGSAGSRRVGGFTLAKEGQDANGDAWDCRTLDGGLAVLVCDGLGHGTFASHASREAVDTFRHAEWRSAKDMLATIDRALHSTRGAAGAIAFIETGTNRVRYCGVGNISACIVTGDVSRHLVSHNGILGHGAARMTEFDYDLAAESLLVMHSDGISARWQPADLGGAWGRHPCLVAGLLYRDFARGGDDVAAVVIKP